MGNSQLYNKLKKQVEENSQGQGENLSAFTEEMFLFFEELDIGVGVVDRTGFVQEYNYCFELFFSPTESLVCGETNLLDLVQMQNRQMITTILSSFYKSDKQNKVVVIDRQEDGESLRLHFSNPSTFQRENSNVIVLCEKERIQDLLNESPQKEGSVLEQFFHSDSLGFWTYTLGSGRLKLDPGLCDFFNQGELSMSFVDFLSQFSSSDRELITGFCETTQEKNLILYHLLQNQVEKRGIVKHHLRLISDENNKPRFVIGYLTQLPTSNLNPDVSEKLPALVPAKEWYFDSRSFAVALNSELRKRFQLTNHIQSFREVLGRFAPASVQLLLSKIRDAHHLPLENSVESVVIETLEGTRYLVSWVNSSAMGLRAIKNGFVRRVRKYRSRREVTPSSRNSFVFDQKKKTIVLPTWFLEVFGFSEQDNVNVELNDLLYRCHANDKASLLSVYRQFLDKRTAQTIVIRFRNQNREWLGVQIEFHDLLDGRKVLGAISLFSPHFSANQFAEQSMFYEAILNLSQEAMVGVSLSGKIIFSNLEFSNLFRIKEEQSLSELICFSSLDWDQFFSEAIRNGKAKTYFLNQHDETAEELEIEAFRMNRLEEGDTLVLYFRPISVKERIDETKDSFVSEETINTNKSSMFLSALSHEIRTPMNAIMGFAELLNDRNLSHSERENFTYHIREKSEQMLNVITKIVQLSNLENEDWKLTPEDVTLDQFLNEIESELNRLKIMFQKHNLLSRVKSLQNLTGLRFRFDLSHFRLALYALLENAIKYTEYGRVDVSCEVREDGMLCFKISDTGIGIPEEKQKEMFNVFWNSSNYYTRRFEGMGTGLSLAKRIAEKLGGDLVYIANDQQGSVFQIEIPSEKSSLELHDLSLKQQSKKVATDYNWATKRILIVDDAPFVLDILSRLLEPTRATVIGVASVKEALVVLEGEKNFDLVLLDVEMPIVSGVELLKESKKRWPQLPVIMQTAYVAIELEEQLRSLGADDYISKPIDTGLLLHKVATIFESK